MLNRTKKTNPKTKMIVQVKTENKKVSIFITKYQISLEKICFKIKDQEDFAVRKNTVPVWDMGIVVQGNSKMPNNNNTVLLGVKYKPFFKFILLYSVYILVIYRW